MFEFIRAKKELILLIAVPILFFYRALFSGEIFFFRDLYLHFLPQKKLLVDTILSGELPLWDPYLHGGQPLLADVNNIVLYPSNVLYFLMPIDQALNIDIIGHILLCGIATYLLGRRLGLKKPAAMIAAVVYSYSGYTLSLGNFLNRILAAPYLPFLLLWWDCFLQEKRKKYFVLASLCGLLQILAGALETFVISAFLILGWSLVYQYPETPGRKLRKWIVLIGVIVTLSAIQIVPLLEMYSQSRQLPAEPELTWSLNPKRLPELFVPRYFGATHTLNQMDYWGRMLEDNRFPYILSIYWGWAALILAVRGAFARPSTRIVPARVRIFLFLCVIFLLALSLGRYFPGFQSIQTFLPFLAWFRFPIKLLQASLLPLALLAGAGAQYLFIEKRPGRIMIACTLMICVLLLAFTMLFYASKTFAGAYEIAMFDTSSEHISRGLTKAFLHAALSCLVFSGLLLVRRFSQFSYAIWLVAGLVTCDLLSAGRNVNPMADRSLFATPSRAGKIVREQLGSGRMYRSKDNFLAVLRAPENNVVWQYRWNLEVLYSYTAAFYKIPLIFHDDYDRLANARIMHLTNLVEKMEWSRKLPVLSAASVSIIFSSDEILNLPQRNKIENASQKDFFIYSNPSAIPKLKFVTSGVFVHTESQSLAAIQSPTFDSRYFAIIEGTTTPPSCTNPEARITTMKSKIHAATYEIQTQCSGYLVFSEPNYAGWKVFVNGRREIIYPANVAFSAVFIPQGVNRIERNYVPYSVMIGAVISLVCGTVLFLYSTRKRDLPSSL